MTKGQYDLILYLLLLSSFDNKGNDFSVQMIVLKKIIEFCKFDFNDKKTFYYKNYDLIKNVVFMLALYIPFKQEILINLYNLDQNYFMNIIQDIIINVNDIKEDKYNNINLININNFFYDEISINDFNKNNSNKDDLYKYFNNKEYFIKIYKKYIEKYNLKEIYINKKFDVYKGIVWTLSSIILKNYYVKEEDTNNIFDKNKNHCIRLFKSLILIFQYCNFEQQKYFIKHYLELIKSLLKEVNIFEDWEYVLDMIYNCVLIILKKENNKELIEKEFKTEINTLNEIFIIILKSYNKNELSFCNLEMLSVIMHKFNQFLKNDSTLCFYIDIYLKHEHKIKKYIIKEKNYDNVYYNFLNNIEVLFFNIFSLNSKSFSKTKNYLLEIIRVNYLNDINTEQENNLNNKDKNISKQIIIERVLEKYLENVFISSGDCEENYTFFNYILLEILSKTKNNNFLNTILTLLIFNSNEKINKLLYNSFVSSILINLFENLINNSTKCNLTKEKLSFLIEFFFDEININDENIFKLGLSVLKHFFINNQYEIIFIKNINDLNNIEINNKHSILVIDYLYYNIYPKKNSFEKEKDFISFHKNYYAPFIVFPHIKLFKAINENLENNINKTNIFESILEFYYLCLSKNILFLKNINLNLFFKIIYDEKDLIKFSTSKKITHYLFKILACLPFQLNSDMIFNTSSENIELNMKNKSYLNNEFQLNIDPKYKISAINFLINFWSKLNIIIIKTLNKIHSNELLSQSIFNITHKETPDLNSEEKNIRLTLHNLMNKGDSYLWCGELNLYAQFDYLYECIKLLKIYLISFLNEYLLSKENNININSKLFSSLKNIIQNIIAEIFISINFKYFNKKYSYYIISLLYSMKELLSHFISEEIIFELKSTQKKSFSYSNIREQYNKIMEINNERNMNKKEIKGINIIYKVIFISLILSWHLEQKIFDTFDKYLGTKYKSTFLSKDKYISLDKYFSSKKNLEEDIQKVIEHLSDIFILFLMEKMPEKYVPMLIDIFDEIFEEKKSYREYYFYKMTEWCLKIRKNRDGININYKNIFDMNYLNNMNNNYVIDEYIGQKVFKNSYVFYGNNNLIIINPISVNKFSFSLRNPICNMNLIFDSDVPIINYLNNKEESSSEEEENEGSEEKEEDKEKNSDNISSDSNDEKNENENNNKIFNFEEGTEEISKRKRKSSEDFNFINNTENKNEKSKEYEDKINVKNYNLYPIRRKRFNTDLGDKYKKSLILAEKKKMMKNCLKLFSILTELTDFKIERYKYFDINENNNLYTITKLIQNLDLIPIYFIHNCALIYHSEINDTNVNSIVSYMNFIQKLGELYNYSDLYPDKNNTNDIDRNIIINQDSFTRINFNILNLTEKDENKLLEQNDIVFIWENEMGTSFNYCCYEKKIKIFFFLTKITENMYKIQRKYNNKKKEEINYIIDDLFFNEFIVDIENQSSIQLLINMIKTIDILLKIYNNNDINRDLIENKDEKKRVKNVVLDNKKINDDYMNNVEESRNNFDLKANYIDENELMNENESPLMKRYKLMSKL